MSSNENLNQHRFALNNGTGEIPALGFGTSLSDNTKTRNAVKTAVEVGFRHLDAAERYRNEAEVGAALKELFADGTVRREDLFVTTKLWNNNHRPERVKPALQASLDRLGPRRRRSVSGAHPVRVPARRRSRSPRTRMERSSTTTGSRWRKPGRRWKPLSTRDFHEPSACPTSTPNAPERSSRAARIKPAVVEVESHPYHPQWELHELCKTHGIILLAFASLGHALEPRLLDDPLIVSIAQRLEKTPAQVLLAWGIQRGTAVLTGSVTPSRIRENFDVTALPESVVQEISEHLRLGSDSIPLPTGENRDSPRCLRTDDSRASHRRRLIRCRCPGHCQPGR